MTLTIRPFLLSVLASILVASLLIAPTISVAQQPAATPPAPTPRSQLEAGRLELGQIEAALQRDTLDDRRLAELRARLEPVNAMAGEIIARELPRAEEIKARIDQLGPAPDIAKGQSESADVARDRAEQQRHWKEADETIRLARTLGLYVDQMIQSIADRRRANFTRQILAQEASILSPMFWLDVARRLPKDMVALQFLAGQWGETIIANTSWLEALFLGALIMLGIVLMPHAARWVRTGSLAIRSKEAEEFEPGNLEKAMHALRLAVLSALLPTLMVYLLYRLLDGFGLLPGRIGSLVEAILGGLAFFSFMSGLARAVLAPEQPRWRLVPFGNRMAIQLSRTIRDLALATIIGRMLEAMYSAIVASLPLTIATKGMVAVITVLLLARGLRRTFGQTAPEENGGESRAHSGEFSMLPLRLSGWCIVVIVLIAVMLGYVSLASFVAGQIVWLSALTLGLIIGLMLIEEGVGSGFSAHGLFGRKLREATGLAAASLDQFSVLGAGLLRLLLLIAIGMLALAPWGLDSAGALGSLRAAFFGFQIGGVTISLSTIAIALVLFAIGLFITRAIQNWLDTRYLPQTGLDPGLRNSIRTIFGYIGIVLAAMVAFSQLGLSFDKLTIVAGALSVGIGFGLQSIVNNFVSGLILLWERPIKVGDWIVVGDEQGTVKHINVRATEIQTFDRASLIIPNSEFISGRVKNWVHADRTARIIIPVNVEYTAEPEIVQTLLREAALSHREVMSEPAPMVIFKNLGESGLDFELRCFCDVDAMSGTRSELLFDIFARLKAAGIAIPYPTRRVEIANVPAGADAAAAITAEIQKGKL